MQTCSIFPELSQLIWFNPDLEIYQTGTKIEFEESLVETYSQSDIEVLYEDTKTSQGLITKLVNSLNYFHFSK